MKILFVGDIYAQCGRQTLARYLPYLKRQHDIDVVIANGENASHGKGLSAAHYQEIIEMGVDIITMGNHFFSKKNTNAFYLSAERLVRPANIHHSAAGVGSRHFDINGHKLRVSNLLGRVYINELTPSNPFEALDKILESNEDVVHIVDFHAEATAEKMALAHAFDGKVSAVIGTHTHVQTADERILPKGSAYITDVGMTGPYHSVIGANIEQVIHKTRTGLALYFDVAKGPGFLSAVVIDINENNGKARKIERIYLTPDHNW